jgi:acyl carrier protein
MYTANKKEIDNIFKNIQDYISDNFEIDKMKIKMESQFISDLGFSSFELMEMCGNMEDIYDIHIDTRDLLTITTIGDFVNYMVRGES